ncbi:PucR family transcriptional regulator [Neomoorella humiferrea]|uniref:Purine catabolism regulatory protein n=1 Tax=Neomoorella humiferrea TaxID=676965 RepID=A0A2T0ALL2_9FIRM|nr:PucR family transcriptional regulator [Moorella humiferrea]PRR69499.1 Purine catabolism regulatory protein [Moorella humiferrea]
MNEHFGIRVEDILKIPIFKKCRVVGGVDGLNRIITNVNVMEVPDILPWIRPGDFIFTTAYAIKDDVEAQKILIPQLAKRGASGLAIKSQRYIETIPRYMIEAANNLSFPLIELPVEVNFSELISSILTQIVNRQASFLEHSVKVHQQFTDLILNGGQLDQIAEALTELIDAYVCLEDLINFRRVIYPPELPGHIMSLFEKNYTDIQDFYRQEINIEGTKLESVILPIIVEGQQYGWVQAIAIDRDFSLFELTTLERVCSIVALDILRQQNVTQVENRYKGEFLNQLLSSPEHNEKVFIERSKTFGWDISKNNATLIFEVLPGHEKKLKIKQQDIKSQAAILLKNYCDRNKLRYFLVNNDEGIILFLESDLVFANNNIIHQLKALLNYWHVTIGIGNGYSGIKGIKKSFREAKLALEVGKYLFGSGQVIYYRDLGVYSLLLKNTDIAELKDFVQEMLGPLEIYDLNKKGELLKTLKTFLETNCNVKETAEKLYMHYNTVLYRVNKIKELIGVDFNNPDQVLNLQVAMRLLEVLERFNKTT